MGVNFAAVNITLKIPAEHCFVVYIHIQAYYKKSPLYFLVK